MLLPPCEVHLDSFLKWHLFGSCTIHNNHNLYLALNFKSAKVKSCMSVLSYNSVSLAETGS